MTAGRADEGARPTEPGAGLPRELARRERLAAIGTMASVLAHEVRSPLAVIVNAVSAMRRTGPRSEDDVRLLAIVDEEVRRLERLVGDLLEFARPDRRTYRELPAAALVGESVDTARQDPRVPATVRVTFRATTAEKAYWDGPSVRQAVVNLVLNGAQAIAAGPRSGEVSVSVEPGPEPGWLRIAVADDGVGVSPDVLDRMFEPFVTTRPQGVGLGLAVVRRVVEDHGGRVRVESEPGRGTRVELLLPTRPPEG